MPQPLPDDAIARELAALPGWAREGEEIVRSFDRGNFNGSIAFVNPIAAAANDAAHHPATPIRWHQVTLRLSPPPALYLYRQAASAGSIRLS